MENLFESGLVEGGVTNCRIVYRMVHTGAMALMIALHICKCMSTHGAQIRFYSLLDVAPLA